MLRNTKSAQLPVYSSLLSEASEFENISEHYLILETHFE